MSKVRTPEELREIHEIIQPLFNVFTIQNNIIMPRAFLEDLDTLHFLIGAVTNQMFNVLPEGRHEDLKKELLAMFEHGVTQAYDMYVNENRSDERTVN